MKYLSAILLALAIFAAQVLHGGVRFPIFADPAYAFLVLAAAAAAIVVWRNPSPATPAALVSVSVFAGYILWRCAEAPDPFLGRIDSSAALTGLLAFVVAASGLPDAKSRFAFLFLLGVAALAQSIVGIIQFGKGGGFIPLGWFSEEIRRFYEARFSTRAHGFYLNPNHYAWLCGWAALFSVAIGCWGRVTVVTRIVLIYFALFFVGADVLAASRGGIMALVAGLLTFAILSVAAVFSVMRHGRVVFASATILLTLLCAGAGWFVYSSNWLMQGRMDTVFTGDLRGIFLENAWRQFQMAPLLGAGPGMFLYAARFFRPPGQTNDPIYAHDDWVQTLAEYGVIGFALAVVAVAILLGGGIHRFFAVLRYRMDQDDRPLSNSAAVLLGAISSLVMFAVHGTVDFNMHVPANALLAGATLGLLASREAVGVSRRIETGVLRAFGFGVMMALAAAVALFLWRGMAADYQSLVAANALAKGDVPTALAATEKGLKSAPDDAALLFTRGRALYAYESYVGMNSESDSAEDDSGQELSSAEREKLYRSAVESLQTAVAQRPLERSYRVELARALAELGEDDAVRKEFTEAIRLEPEESYPYSAYGDFLQDREAWRDALSIYGLGRRTANGTYAAYRYLDVAEEVASLPEDKPDERETGTPRMETSKQNETGGTP